MIGFVLGAPRRAAWSARVERLLHTLETHAWLIVSPCSRHAPFLWLLASEYTAMRMPWPAAEWKGNYQTRGHNKAGRRGFAIMLLRGGEHSGAYLNRAYGTMGESRYDIQQTSTICSNTLAISYLVRYNETQPFIDLFIVYWQLRQANARMDTSR